MSVSNSGIHIDVYDVECSGSQWIEPSEVEGWIDNIKTALSGVSNLSFEAVEIYQKYSDETPST
jgi:hypothetical protein